MADDCYTTITRPAEGYHTDKRSRFLSFALPVSTPQEAREAVDGYRRQFYDARHVCWAYQLGPDGQEYRYNDDGEPSSTAGKPIWGQIRAHQLTDVLVVVVRYFGGIELGTGGLMAAYRQAAAQALASAPTEVRTVDEEFTVTFDYPHQNSVLRILKEEGPTVISKQFDTHCRMCLRVRKGQVQRLKSRLDKVPSLRFL